MEVNVPPQMKLFTEDTHVQVYLGDKMVFDIHGTTELEKVFSQFTATVKRSHHAGILYCRAALATEVLGA